MKTELRKQAYTAPRIEVIEMENEGTVMVASLTNGGTLKSSSNTRSYGSTRSYRSAGSSDLEDMINDILTVEN